MYTTTLSSNVEAVLNQIKLHGKEGIFQKRLIIEFEKHAIIQKQNRLSSATIKRILPILKGHSLITQKRFGQQVKFYASPPPLLTKEHPITNKKIYQSLTIEDESYHLSQIIVLHNRTNVSTPFPEGVYSDRCWELPNNPKISINGKRVKYKILDAAPYEIRFKILGEIAPCSSDDRGDEMTFKLDYYHRLHIERPTDHISIKVNYKGKMPPSKYPICEEWCDGILTNTFSFKPTGQRHFELVIPCPAEPLAYYKTLFFPKPKNR